MGDFACPRCGGPYRVAASAPADVEVCPLCLYRLVLDDTGGATVQAPAAFDEIPDPHAPPEGLKNYEILGMLGAGGMGTVWKAKQRGLDRFVAIKVLSRRVDAEEIERFFREARAAAKLRHPHIVPIHEVSSEAGRYFYAMDFVDGETLDQAVKGGRLPRRRGLEALAKIARAVHFAHENGVVHRDIKPANILLDVHGEPSIADFGLAKDLSAIAGLTQSGEILGTPSYMAPEQAGAKHKEIDVRTDVYALGGTLYFLVTGKPPHQGTDVYDVIRKVVEEEPAAPRASVSDLPLDVETICLKALRKDPRGRYPSALAFAEDVERFLNGESIHARPMGVLEKAALGLRRQRRPLAFAGLAALVVAVALGAWQRSRPALLEVATIPPGASVVVDGTAVEGVTPTRGISLPPGERTVRVSRPGHEEIVRKILLDPGSRRTLALELVPIRGFLSAAARTEGARVILTDETGRSTEAGLPLLRFPLPVGRYQARIAANGQLDALDTLDIAAGEELRREYTLVERLAGLARPNESFSLTRLEATSGGMLHVFGEKKFATIDAAELRHPTWRGLHLQPSGPAGTAARAERVLGLEPLGVDGAERILVETSAGWLEARSEFDKPALWKLDPGPWKIEEIVAVGDAKTPGLVYSAMPAAPGGKPRTLLRRISGKDGSTVWEAMIDGVLEHLVATSDVDGDGGVDLLAWDRDLVQVAGSDGRVIQRISRDGLPPLLLAALLPGDPAELLLVAPGEATRMEAKTGLARWKVSRKGIFYATLAGGAAGKDVVLFEAAGVSRWDGRTGRELWTAAKFIPDPLMLAEDLNRDGVEDLIFRDRQRFIRCLSGSTGEALWNLTLEDFRLTSLALQGLGWVVDQGGQAKILLASPFGDVVALRPELTGQAAFLPLKTSYHKPCVVVTDGAREFRVAAASENLLKSRTERASGTAWETPIPASGKVLLAAGSGGEILAAGAGGSTAWAGAFAAEDGKKRWEFDFGPVSPETLPLLLSSRSVGHPFVLAGASSPGRAAVKLLDTRSGEAAWSVDVKGLRLLGLSPPALAADVYALVRDQQGGTRPLTLNARLQVLDRRDGRVKREFPLWLDKESTSHSTTLALGDVDGDADPEILVYSGSWLQLIRGRDGKILWIRQFASGDGVVLGFQDVDGDGKREAVASGMYTICLNGADGSLRWGMEGFLAGPADVDPLTLYSHEFYSILQVEARSGRVLRKAPVRIREDGRFVAAGIDGNAAAALTLALEGITASRVFFEADLADHQTMVAPTEQPKRRTRTAWSTMPIGRRTNPAVLVPVPPLSGGTPAEAVREFLSALMTRQIETLRQAFEVELPAPAFTPDLLDRLDPAACRTLAAFLLLSTPGSVDRRFEWGIREVLQEGDLATVLITKAAGPLGDSFRVVRSSGVWRVLLRP